MSAIRLFAPAGSALRIGSNTATVVTPGASTLDWAGRPVIRRIAVPNTTTGGHVMVYRRGSGHAVNDGGLYIKFRDTSGAWSDENKDLLGNAISGFPLNPPLSAGEDAGEPYLYEAPNGDFLLQSWRVDYNVTNAGTYQWRDTAHIGASWTSEGQIDFTGVTGDNNIFPDDHFVYNGSIYMAARSYTNAAQTASAMYLMRSDDNGATWANISTIMTAAEGTGGGASEAGLTLLPDLSILCIIRDISHVSSYKRISTNLGSTWGTLTDITSTPVGIIGRPRIFSPAQLQGLSNWWLDKRRIMTGFIHTQSGNSHPRRTYIWLSRNAGTTWKALAVDNESNDSGYGDLAWEPVARKYIYMSYRGTIDTADIKEYLLDLGGSFT